MTFADAVTSRRRDPVVTDAFLMTALMIALAGFGGIFWVVAGRLETLEAVGIAATLITAIVVLSYVAQLGVDRSLLAALPHSDRPRCDLLFAVAVSGGTGFALGWAFATILPSIAPAAAPAVEGVRGPAFGALVAGTAVNLTTDSALLAIRRVGANLAITGVLMGVLKCTLPFAFVAFGAFGLASGVGVASIVAAVICVAVCLGAMEGPLGLRPSPRFRQSVGLGTSMYAANLIDLVPTLLTPILIVRASGAAESALYCIAYQIALMLYATAGSIANSGFADALRRPELLAATMRRSAWLMAGVLGAGTLVLVLLAEPLLAIFGSEYAADGVTTLRLLAVGALPIGCVIWALNVLRLRGRLAMAVVAALVSCASTIALVAWAAGRGSEWVAVAWIAGHAIGGLLGSLLVWKVRIR